MSGSVNKVVIIGNLCADVEIRRTQAGKPIANMRVATSESWKDSNSGERKEKSEFHSVVILQGFNSSLVMLDGPKGETRSESRQDERKPSFSEDLNDELVF